MLSSTDWSLVSGVTPLDAGWIVLKAIAGWLLISLIVRLVGRWIGGRPTMGALLRTLGFAQMPSVVGAAAAFGVGMLFCALSQYTSSVVEGPMSAASSFGLSMPLPTGPVSVSGVDAVKFGFSLWGLLCSVVAVREALGVSTLRAIVALVLAELVLLIPAIIALIGLLALWFAS